MGLFFQEGNTLIWQENQQKVWLQPWGKNGLRVQANLSGEQLDIPQALLETPSDSPLDVLIDVGKTEASIRSGLIRATVSTDGHLCFSNIQTGQVLLEEPERRYYAPPNRHFKYRNGRLHKIEAWFKANEGERLYGLGQHQHGYLDQKGCVIVLRLENWTDSSLS